MQETNLKTQPDGSSKNPLFTRGYRRQNRKHWKWIMKCRRKEIQDAIFGWIERYYISDSGAARKTDWRAILGSSQLANDWAGSTSRAIRHWAEGPDPDDSLNPKYVVDTLYKFERYCDRHFRIGPDGKRRRPPYIPAYPSFEKFCKEKNLNSRKSRRPSGTRVQHETVFQEEQAK